MVHSADALVLVKARLCEAVDRIAGEMPRLPRGRLVERLEEAQALALGYGFLPFADVARSLGRALSTEASAPVISTYLHALRDAAACGRADDGVGEVYLASISLRLAG